MSLTYRGTDICDGVNIFIDLETHPDSPPDVRGEDLIIPGLAGRVEMIREVDVLNIELHGIVIGTGETVEARRTSFYEAMGTVLSLLDRTATAGALVASGGYYGITGSRSVNARAVDFITGRISGWQSVPRQTIDITLQAVDGTGWDESS